MPWILSLVAGGSRERSNGLMSLSTRKTASHPSPVNQSVSQYASQQTTTNACFTKKGKEVNITVDSI